MPRRHDVAAGGTRSEDAYALALVDLCGALASAEHTSDGRGRYRRGFLDAVDQRIRDRFAVYVALVRPQTKSHE
jgi:hypothetical protein